MTITEQMKFIDDYEAALNAATGSAVDSNANVVEKNIATLGTELDKTNHIELQRAMMRKYLIKLYGEEFADQYEADLKHHIIYRHDETAGSGGFPYCVAMSMYPFLLDGLTKVGGGSTAPHHLKEFVGGFCNLMFIVAAQFAGAVASPEFLTYFDHFARNDYGQDYMQRLDEVIEPCRGLTMREMLTGYFGQVVYTINQPAAARGNQSIFWNIAYFDSDYFASIFEGFVFPDGDEPKWESVKELQKLFMDWFNQERLRTILTFPVETANMHTRPLTEREKAELTAKGISLVDSQGNPKRAYADEEMAQFFCKMWSEGASFFMYQSDSVDALSSCCFGKDQKVLARSHNHGVTTYYYDTFENLGKTKNGPNRKLFQVYNNGGWSEGRKIKLPNRPMYRVRTANNKEIIVSDNHLNPTLRGDVVTSELTTNDYLLFNTAPLGPNQVTDQHLTFEQGFAVGAFLGDGSFGGRVLDAEGNSHIYEVNYSQNAEKYVTTMRYVNIALEQLGCDNQLHLNQIVNNVYPLRTSSRQLVDFIQHWTNWAEGTDAHNKQLNLEVLEQSLEFRYGILMGWYNTDGGNNNRCYTISPLLAEHMEILINSLGLISNVTVSDRTDETVVIRNETFSRNYPLYCVRWYDISNKRTMADTYIKRLNSTYFKITSIEPIDYTDDIYCFEMSDSNDPYFTLPNGIITHNCRLRNAVEREPFSYTLGAGGVETGSKAVITMNLNRIVQDWANIRIQRPALTDYIAEITTRIHKYLTAFNAKLWDDFKAGMLTIYNAGFIELDKQYLTVGINGFVEAAEYLRIPVRPEEPRYRQLAADILGTIGRLNDEHKTQHEKFNTEFVPAENLAIKFYNWDKRDGYTVPLTRNCYNSYFYPVEVAIDPVKRFYYQGYGFADQCSGGVALHNNLEEHLDALTYRKLMDVALDAGCNYFTYNVRNTVCRSCGHIDKHTLDECPVCHGHALSYATRVIGYLKLEDNFSAGRQVEASRRKYTSPAFDAEDLD